MDSETSEEPVFKEYKELGPKTTTKAQYLIALFHIIAAIAISIVAWSQGLEAWFTGFGLLTPILLILLGAFMIYVKDHNWHRDQMIPFMLGITMMTEIEADQYVRHHRRLIWYALVTGWLAIIICQMVWTFGLTIVMPIFSGDDLLTRIVAEFIAYAVIFGPFFLYAVLLFLFYAGIELFMRSKNKDIQHLFEIEEKWAKEDNRRKEDARSKQEASEDPADS